MSRLISLLFVLTLAYSSLAPAQQASREEVIRQASARFVENMISAIDADYSEVDSNVYRFTVKGGYNVLLLNKFDDIQLYAVFTGGKVSMSRINDWNRLKRFSRAYLDKDGDPVLEADLDFEGGVTNESVARFVALFVQSLASFDEHLR
ncbi:MAG: YbjN domain-containing protein [Xanthomonadales bacterium]|nr:YbjN domain-containing protein [Xanthomonadales bacterium]